MNFNIKKVFIMRGIPGSGKSTWVNKTIRNIDENLGVDCNVVSADDYFVTFPTHTVDSFGNKHQEYYIGQTVPGVYKFDPSKLNAAHTQCQNRFMAFLKAETPMYIFVDNTNTTKRELDFYVKACEDHGVEYIIVNVITDPEVAATRNKHGVPPEKVRQMAKRMAAAQIPKEYKQTTVYGVIDAKTDAAQEGDKSRQTG